MNIIEVAVFTPVRRNFDYTMSDTPIIGARVKVPFGRRQLIGIIIGVKTESGHKLKPIIECLDDHHFITPEVLTLCEFSSQYYHYPIGEILQSALPKLLREGQQAELSQQRWWKITNEGQCAEATRSAIQQQALELLKKQTLTDAMLKCHGVKSSTLKTLEKKEWIESFTTDKIPELSQPTTQPLTLNNEQAVALKTISASMHIFAPFLLDGVTGSGKTEVYLQLIQRVLEQGKQALVLIPEIGLTPQTLSRFQQRFNTLIVVLHSGLSDRERSDAWLLAKKGLAKIVIGTRSAIFTPMPDLGLIIIDEEHDLSFKQQDSFRYHARDLSMVRAKQRDIPIVLGSATPALETLHNARQGKYYYCHLSKRTGSAGDPQFHIIDTRRNKLNDAGLSKPLIQSINETLARGEQALLFINRRGYAPVMMCKQCGFVADCDYCEAHLTVHQTENYLACHHCGFHTPIPPRCPSCADDHLNPVGIGTEKIATNIEKYFPDTPIHRIDRDSTRKKGALKAILHDVNQGKPCLLVGTQMLAKGHHFKKVTLVGILNADNGLFNPDFRACERFGQLLLQVAGRAGRESLSGHVYIQTLHPDNQLLHALLEQGYSRFAEHLLTERQLTQLPPYSHLGLLRASANQQERVHYFLNQVKQHFLELKQPLQILGPIPAALPKRAGRYHCHLLIQSTSRQQLHRLASLMIAHLQQHPPPSQIRWQLEIDPLETV